MRLFLLIFVLYTLVDFVFTRSYRNDDDWLIRKWDRRVVFSKIDDPSICLKGFECFELSNGIISRRFLHSADRSIWTTLDIFSHMKNESSVRALSGEGSVTLNGLEYYIGGLNQTSQQVQSAYWNSSDLETEDSILITRKELTFFYDSHFTSSPVAPFPWTPGTRHSPKDTSWPPKGLTLNVKFTCETFKDLYILLHYEMYEGIPLQSKWISIHRGLGSRKPVSNHRFESLRGHDHYHHYKKDRNEYANEYTGIRGQEKRENEFIIIDSIFMEDLRVRRDYSPMLFAPYPSNPPRKYVDPSTSLMYVVTDQAHGADVNWELDEPQTKSCPGSSQPRVRTTYSVGPGVYLVPDGSDFVSFRTLILLTDSLDRERSSLSRRKIYRTLAPTTLESPLFFHLSNASTPEFMHHLVNQISEVGGFDMIIYSFGSNFEFESMNASYIEEISREIAYARSKGIEVGGYDLIVLQRGKGGYGKPFVGDDFCTVTSTGKYGPDACFACGWNDKLDGFVHNFLNRTGLSMLETDGPYGGEPCYSTKHKYHMSYTDSVYHQERLQGSMYSKLRAKNVFINQPDNYFFQGGSKTGMGYNENQFSLPRWQDLTITRQGIYDDTYEKIPTMGWSQVPLVDYHAGGEEAAFSPVRLHLKEYEFALSQHLGNGISACFRGIQLFDDDKSKDLVKKWTSFWTKHRSMVNSDVIHVKRADGRGLDAMLHVNPFSKNQDRALLMVFNQMTKDVTVREQISVNLYYAGLDDYVFVRKEDQDPPMKFQLKRDYSIELVVDLPPESVTWFTFSTS